MNSQNLKILFYSIVSHTNPRVAVSTRFYTVAVGAKDLNCTFGTVHKVSPLSFS